MRRGKTSDESVPTGRSASFLSGTNLTRAGDHNQRVTLHAVRINGPVTRNDLVLQTGLTPAAIANITNRLLSDQLILNAGRMRGARGQPASKFVINPDSRFSIGLNVDRDHVTLVVLDFVGKVRGRASREIHFARPEAVRTFFQRSVGQLLLKAGIARDRLVGVGVAFPDDIARAHLPDQPARLRGLGDGPNRRSAPRRPGYPGVHRERRGGGGHRRDAIRLGPSISELFLPAGDRGARRGIGG